MSIVPEFERVLATLQEAIAAQRIVDVQHGARWRQVEPQAMGFSPTAGPILLAWERNVGWRFIVAAEVVQVLEREERFGLRHYPNDVAGPLPTQPATVMRLPQPERASREPRPALVPRGPLAATG